MDYKVKDGELDIDPGSAGLQGVTHQQAPRTSLEPVTQHSPVGFGDKIDAMGACTSTSLHRSDTHLSSVRFKL